MPNNLGSMQKKWLNKMDENIVVCSRCGKTSGSWFKGVIGEFSHNELFIKNSEKRMRCIIGVNDLFCSLNCILQSIKLIVEGPDEIKRQKNKTEIKYRDVIPKPIIPTAEQWREMTNELKKEWNRQFRVWGIVSFRCINCGWPTESGMAWCVSCCPERFTDNV